MAGDDGSIHSQDSKELDPPPSKKSKIETDTEAKTEEEADTKPKGPPGSFFFKGRLIRSPDDDPECARQRERFCKQFDESEGFDVEWDSFDYVFGVYNFDWQPCLDDDQSNEDLMKLLIQAAISEHDNEYGTKLESVEYVSANIVTCKGFLFYITFLAKDLKSPNQEPKPYQAKVWRFCDETEVLVVRLKPTHHHNLFSSFLVVT